jgi:signal transduction histidine kinase
LQTEAKKRDIQIDLYLADGLPKILIDKEQIKQVSMNIILNAIQSIEGKGSAEIFTRLFVKNGSGQFVQIEVRDNGIGIPEGDLENIFNPFFTTKDDGNGLGLSICQQIVQEHGGYIVVESKVGEGTAFFVNLPVNPVNRAEAKSRSHVYEENFGNR